MKTTDTGESNEGGVCNHKGGQTGSKAAKKTHSHYQSKTGSGDKKRTDWENMNSIKTQERYQIN